MAFGWPTRYLVLDPQKAKGNSTNSKVFKRKSGKRFLGRLYLAKPYSAKSESAVQESAKRPLNASADGRLTLPQTAA